MRFLGAGLSFVFTVLLARLFGADEAGIYFLAFMVTSVAGVFGRFGLDNVVLRHVAAGSASSNHSEVKGVYRKGIMLALAVSSLVTVVVFLLSPWLAEAVFSKPALSAPLRLMSFSIVPLAFITLHAEALKGLQRIIGSMFVRFVGVLALSIAGVYLLAGWGIEGAVCAYIIALIFMAITGRFLWKRATVWLDGASGEFKTSKLFESSLPLLLVQLMQFVLILLPSFMLGVWGTGAEVGIFESARRTTMLIGLILIVVNVTAAPKFAELYRQGDIDTLSSIAKRSRRLMALCAAPVTVLFVLFPSWIMGFFGPEFRAGAGVLALLSVGQFVNVATGSVVYLLVMSGNERAVRNNVAMNLVISLLLCIILIPRFGLMGAGLSGALSVSLLNLTMAALVYRYLAINMWKL
jgi:O-antigen/teichoic acid export membrane protein